jgi:hypothetical protein
MNVSDRDRKMLMAIVPLVVVLGYWFVLFSPKREAASTAAQTLTTVQSQLADAESSATTVQAAKTNFADDYAAVVALGKAIPTSVDMPSLLVQLDQAAHGTGIKLDGVTTGPREAATAPAATGAPAAPDPGAQPTAPSGQPPQSAPGAAAASAQGAADAASTPPPTADQAGTSPEPAAAGGTGVPGTPVEAAAPTGALESVALEFNFSGSFFELANFFHRLKRFVYVAGEKVRVRGRLLTIDRVQYEADPETFPRLKATVNATVYLSPKAEGTTAGATPTGPGATATAAPATATATTSTTPPTPTATATP